MSSIPPLLPDSHELLATKLEPFVFGKDRNARVVRDELIDVMQYYNGIGLAANQIGITDRAFAMYIGMSPMVLFNPVIMELSIETTILEEGCLSFPDLSLKIKRPRSCRIIYDSVMGSRESILLDGLECRVAMHEVDHINGIVFTSKVSKLKLDMAKKRLKKH